MPLGDPGNTALETATTAPLVGSARNNHAHGARQPVSLASNHNTFPSKTAEPIRSVGERWTTCAADFGNLGIEDRGDAGTRAGLVVVVAALRAEPGEVVDETLEGPGATTISWREW
jgi:hypothetical protein